MRQCCPACTNPRSMTNDYGTHWSCLQCGWNGSVLTFPLPKLTGIAEDLKEESKTMRHGDKKEEFETGAQRDTDDGKGTPSLISPVLIHRLGVLLQKGAKHYGADNWMKGMPYRRTADSMIRHIFQWLAGDAEEDHLAAVCFGAMCLMTYESRRTWDPRLDDRCMELEEILPAILTSPPPEPTLEKMFPKLDCCRCGGSIAAGTGFTNGVGDTICRGCR